MLRVLLFWLPLSVAVAYGLASLTGQAAAVVVGLTLLGLAVLLALFWLPFDISTSLTAFV